MNILHVIPSVAERYGGPSAAIRQECLALEALGAGTLIATTDADGDGCLPVTLGQARPHHGIPTLFFHRLWSEAYKYAPGFARWIGAHARDFDVVHIRAVLSHLSLAAARACLAAHVPYIMEPLGTLDDWSLAQKPWRKRVMLAAAGRRALAGASAIRCTSSEEKRQTEALLGVDTAVVVPLAIDTSMQKIRPAASRERDPFILVLSRLHPVKGLELLIDAFEAATAAVPDTAGWRLVIAGDGDPAYVQALRARANASAASSRISFEGWVDGDRKATLLTAASLFALPSHHENFGMSLAEALACGVPVIVSPHVQLADAVRESQSGWVSELAIDSLVAALREAMASREQRRARGEHARTLGETFSAPSVGRQLAELYERLAGMASPVSSASRFGRIA